MAPDHERYAQWDAAYVLGALDSAERREYEAHLEVCERCRAAIAELAPMPGLLGRLTVEQAESVGRAAEPEPTGTTSTGPEVAEQRPGSLSAAPPADLIDLVVARDRRRRRRRTALVLGIAAAVALVVALPFGVARLTAPPQSAPIALEKVADSALTAQVRLTGVGWGTRIDMDCAYGESAATPPKGGWLYGLYVTDADGETSQVSTWRVTSRQDVALTAATAVRRDDIRRIEIRALPSGAELLGVDPS